MPNFAVIQNNFVVNVIVADTLAIAKEVTNLTCVDITNMRVGIGYTYIDGKFEPPDVEFEIPLTEG
jgi:hypothetical protein